MTNNILSIVLITQLFLLGTVAGAAELHEGILGYRWGESVSRSAELSKLGEKGEVIYYTKPGETYTIGDVSTENVIYGFYQDQLFGVYLNIDSIEVYDKLLNHLKSLYGLPATKTRIDNSLVYKWKQKNIIIKLKADEPIRKMKLAFYYQPLSSQLNAQQWEELDTSSFRFVPIEKDKKPEKLILFEF
ncbi:hypothetical protein [Desulfopila sp. IMCC35008]|uniref:hypothetical protein n=1 Tax=Desulfopila sp. IMCC35008 TaxID=2653858 RepID=UPI0013CF6EF6|nr:hypothetical protein [Desulfopila sp. IMCC35008]